MMVTPVPVVAAVAAFCGSKYSPHSLDIKRGPVSYPSLYSKKVRIPRTYSTNADNRRRRGTSYAITRKLARDDNQDSEENTSVSEQVESARNFRQTGILLGFTFLVAASALGAAADIIDPPLLLAPTAAALLCFVINTLSYNEPNDPLPGYTFEVKESTIPNAGNGLFATSPIPANTYLFDYFGEKLSEEEYFARYPDGQGRYVAVIDEQAPLPGLGRISEPTYIDGVDPVKSNLARYMNSKSMGEEDGANVSWKKQRYGDQAGCMHFYTIRDVKAGDELCFDYGDNYWDAVAE